VKEFAPNATIVGRYVGGTHEFGEQSVAQLLADGVSFDVILSINDAGAYGAIAAMDQAGIDPATVAVFSVDAEQLAQEHIRNDYFMRGSVATARTEYAQAAVNMLVRQLAGSTIPEVIVLAPGEMVTKETLADS
jgi:ABC-type sugar transport system substrate-binding protein